MIANGAPTPTKIVANLTPKEPYGTSRQITGRDNRPANFKSDELGLRVALSAPPPYAAVLKAKVCLVGGMGVGKTSLIRRYVLDEFRDEYIATLGAKVSKRPVEVELPGIGTVLVEMTLWDTMGDAALRPTLQDVVMHGARGILAVCDASDDRTVAPVEDWANLAFGHDPDIPVQILVNKSDLEAKAEAVRDAVIVSRRHTAPGYLTSAKTGNNVVRAFEDLAMRIATRAFAERAQTLDPISLDMVIHASVKPRSPDEFAAEAGLSPRTMAARAESLVRRGFLRIASIDLGSDGRPLSTFSATGKSFPPLETRGGDRPSRE